jgi:beta-lactam-binding protein with PASTA domain
MLIAVVAALWWLYGDIFINDQQIKARDVASEKVEMDAEELYNKELRAKERAKRDAAREAAHLERQAEEAAREARVAALEAKRERAKERIAA